MGDGVATHERAVPLVRTKLAPPLLRADLVPRPRLIERMARAGAVPLTLISAPAGFGKTTLVQDWLRSSAGGAQPLAWISLDEDDNDPNRFLAYLAAALEPRVPAAAGEALAMLARAHPGTAKAILAPLINAIAQLSTDLVLVLDDYHLIDDPAVHQAVAFLLDHMPQRMHLVLVTRADPPLPLPRLRVRYWLLELRATDLRFTPEEAATFLNAGMGLQLSSADIALLEARTEGWIAGLQLAALALQGRQDVAAALATLSGSHPFVFDYLAEEILQRQPAELQAFLIHTSILDRLSAPLCDELQSGANASGALLPAQQALAQLEQRNLFLTPLDGTRHWYRYHQLFRDFLRARLSAETPALAARLQRLAAGWYERQGLAEEALPYALASQEWPSAARLVERVGPQTLRRGEIATLQHWLAALPPDIIPERPRLALLQAWLSLLSLQLGATEALLDAAERELARNAEPDTDAAALAGELVALRAMSAVFRGDIHGAAVLASATMEQLADENVFVRSLVALDTGVAAVVEGDTSTAVAAFVAAASASQQAGNPLLTAIALWQCADQLVVQGQLQRAAQTYDEIIRLMTDLRGQTLPLAGMAYSGLGELFLEWDRLEQAGHYLEQGVELSLRWNLITALDGLRNLARLSQLQGRQDAAHEALRRATEIARQSEFVTLDHVSTAIPYLRIWIEEGDDAALAEWAATARALLAGKEGAGGLSYLAREATNLALARVLLVRDGPTEALGRLEEVLPEARRRGRHGIAHEARTLRCVALSLLGRRDEALAELDQVLRDAEPEGYLQLFVEQRAALLPLLRALQPQRGDNAYLRRLIRTCEQRRGAGTGATVGPPQPWTHAADELLEPLSERERAVLRLIAAGLSNQEIASRLVITHGTVKTHINNLYGKLGVSSRTRAIARARTLKLLEE